MGLDLSFNAKIAIDSGASVRVFVTDYREHGEPCQGFGYGFSVPGMENASSCELVMAEGEYSIIVRANKWGRAYEPITDFLTLYGIKWEEF